MAAPALSGDYAPTGIAGRVRGRPLAVALLALAALVVVGVAGVGLGTVRIGPLETIGVVLWRTLGLDVGATWTPAVETIVWELRLPRVLTAMVIGAGLAVAGATFQGLLRNPLADPFVLGTASGAALGAAVAILLPVQVAFLAFGLLHALAFGGALLAAFVVFRLGGVGGAGGLTRLLLTGYAVASILTALLTMAMYVSGSDLRQIFSFLLGGLGGASWTRLAVATPLVLAACLLIGLRARSLDGMLLGDAAARHLGLNVARERGILLALASMATAAGVAISGLIGFVGLVVPHVVRLVVGPSARRVLPISAVVGAGLLAGADLVARLVGDVPVGVVMALLGAPFFLFLLRRTHAGYEL
ncbi:iron ABC transporter permease [soil metagenome]